MNDKNRTNDYDDNDEDDEFFGNDDSDNDDFMALQEGKAAERNLQNTAYLDAFDEHKEVRLQEGFESGYREIHELANALGKQLGKMVANAKLEPDQETQAKTRNITQQFQRVLRDINRGIVPNEMAKQQLMELEEAVKNFA